MRKNITAASALLAAGLLATAACSGAGGPGGGGGKITDDKVVLAVLTDESGVYADLAGKGSVAAAKLAVADFKKKYGDKAVSKNITVIDADHQSKPDIANSKAQELYDRRKADVILDVPTSSAALAVASQAKAKKKVFIDTGAATTALTGKSCNKYTFGWAYDTYMLANGTGKQVTEAGAKTWYIVYPNYAFGQDMNKSFTAAVTKSGGQIVRSDPAPFPNDNFSTFLLKAPTLNPKPNVIGAMQAGGDLVNLVKQYNEFKLRDKGIGLAVGLMFLTDIRSIGVESLAGTKFTDAWYWDFDDQNRKFADEFKAQTGKRPSFDHAAVYSAAFQYLEAVQAAKTDNSDKVVAGLEGKKIDDVFSRNGTVLKGNHRLIHDAYLVEVKQKSEVVKDEDFEKVVKTIPADQAFQSVEQSGCSMTG
ncbi:MAG: ABC transporter substrate-binding protein [Mycobacteriales bacterium]